MRDLAIALLLALTVASLDAAAAPLQKRVNVRLTATPAKRVFAPGEPIEIILRLKNTGRVPVAVSDYLDGNFQVRSLRRNGRRVPARKFTPRYDDDLAAIVRQNLTTLAPGKSLFIRWISTPDAALSGQALTTAWPGNNSRSPSAKNHLVGAAGKYRLSMVYQYVGRSAPGPRIFRGRTNAAAVTFRVSR